MRRESEHAPGEGSEFAIRHGPLTRLASCSSLDARHPLPHGERVTGGDAMVSPTVASHAKGKKGSSQAIRLVSCRPSATVGRSLGACARFMAKSSNSFLADLRAEAPVLVGAATTVIFFTVGKDWADTFGQPAFTVGIFVWLFAAMMWCAVILRRAPPCVMRREGEDIGV